MSNEQPKYSRPEDEFGLTEREQMYDRISHARLLELLEDSATIIHRVEESYNNYGEFMFVTVSRPGKSRRILVGFWGLGFHEYRERWLTDEWRWYLANALPETTGQQIPLEEAKELLEKRLESIRPYVGQPKQSERGRLFEALADLTDEDGAYTEMEDLDDLADWPE
jgi:hypothetical protein